MLWVKAFHIIAIISWFGGLFYLPRLFVYHADLSLTDSVSYNRFYTMERRLFWGIMTPSAFFALLLGVGLVHGMGYSFSDPWLFWKLVLVCFLVLYHIYCGVILNKFKSHQNRHSAFFYRVFNEISVLLLIGVILLVVIKPNL